MIELRGEVCYLVFYGVKMEFFMELGICNEPGSVGHGSKEVILDNL